VVKSAGHSTRRADSDLRLRRGAGGLN
jgi:hypothetical protein